MFRNTVLVVIGALLTVTSLSCDDQLTGNPTHNYYCPETITDTEAFDTRYFSVSLQDKWVSDPRAGAVFWSFDGGGGTLFDIDIMVGEEGDLFAGGTSDERGDRAIFCLSPDGSLKWEAREAGNPSMPRLLLAPDGTLYDTMREGDATDCDRVRALDSEQGTETWSARIPDGLCIDEIVASEAGGVVVRTANAIYSISSAGELQWSVALLSEGPADLPLQLSTDGAVVYASDYDGDLSVVRAIREGQELWRYEDEDSRYPADSVVVGKDGTVYLSDALGVAAVDSTGKELWNYAWGSTPRTSIPGYAGTEGQVDDQDQVYFVDRVHLDNVLQFTKDGQQGSTYRALGNNFVVSGFVPLGDNTTFVGGQFLPSGPIAEPMAIPRGQVSVLQPASDGATPSPSWTAEVCGAVNRAEQDADGISYAYVDFPESDPPVDPLLYVFDSLGYLYWTHSVDPSWTIGPAGTVAYRSADMTRIKVVGPIE